MSASTSQSPPPMEEPPPPPSPSPPQHHRVQRQEEDDHHQPQQQPQQTTPSSSPREKECTHKAKLIQFLGRTTPVILQNDNGPCPLLAICNVLLLRNNLNLSADAVEVSQEKLLSLVAERLIDSNSNVDNKDAGYVENQQQNIADAIELLPRLATGIDVNIKYRRIDDFEFTPECAIFDLLDIPLYHGWIVDPQDYDTANAIGSKSYNALMEELVALETQNMHKEPKVNTEEDCVDFAAATTATLGVPSPSLSKAMSFDDSPHSTSNIQIKRKGDLEEEAELLRVLKLSEAETPDSVGESIDDESDACNISAGFDESTCLEKVAPIVIPNAIVEPSGADCEIHLLKPSTTDNHDILSGAEEATLLTKTDGRNFLDHSVHGEANPGSGVIDKVDVDSLLQVKDALLVSSLNPPQFENSSSKNCFQENEVVEGHAALMDNKMEPLANQSESSVAELASSQAPDINSKSSNGTLEHIDTAEALSPSANSSEPIYEGEECILDSGRTAFEDHEPVYEGEVILAEQADRTSTDAHNVRCKDAITPQQGELINNFLRSSASQLTFFGLFSLQDGLKERELCVFFRNNHFSTMFKYEGELYLLATDQGYLNQPDLVWEKLNEVNGDTLFMTSNFKEFNMENQSSQAWDEHNAMTNTADYLASIDGAAQAGLDMNSDLQLAIALQQQEFEQQNSQRQSQQPSSVSGSRLITGPQVPRHSGRNSSSSNRTDVKSKDRCSIM